MANTSAFEYQAQINFRFMGQENLAKQMGLQLIRPQGCEAGEIFRLAYYFIKSDQKEK